MRIENENSSEYKQYASKSYSTYIIKMLCYNIGYLIFLNNWYDSLSIQSTSNTHKDSTCL